MMDSFELNKIAGAILGTCLLVLGLQSFAGIVYHSEKPEKPGFEIEVADAGTGDAADDGKEEAAAVPLATLLASASAEAGQSQAKKCAACHTFEQGGANKIGPNLYEIVGRAKAADGDFAYSDALKEMGGDWTYEDLAAFIANPKGFAPGTKMAFAGVKNDGQLADLIVYLHTLAANPVPLPEAPAAEAPAAEAPATEAPAAGTTAPASAEQPAAPAAEQPAAPATEQPAAPTMEQPAAPAMEQPAAPTAEQPAAPMTEQPAAPAGNAQ